MTYFDRDAGEKKLLLCRWAGSVFSNRSCITAARRHSRIFFQDLSLPYLTAAWKIQCRSASAKIVLVSLADNYNSITGLCCPSITTIAKRCCLSRHGVINIIRQLEKDGWLKVQRKYRQSSRYWFTFAPESGEPRSPTGKRHSPRLVNPVHSNRNGTVINQRSENKWLKEEAPKSTAPPEVINDMIAELKKTVL